MSKDFQLVLLPGLGADARLFESQRVAFPNLVVPPWILPKKNEMLVDYAARMAETIPRPPDIPLILGGVSFGGMVAYEMSQILKPSATVLIASCRTWEGLRRGWRLGAYVTPWMPVCTWSLAKWLATPTVRIASHFGARDRRLAVTMFKEMDSAYMNWVLSAILRWRPSPPPDVPVFQIHGRRDLMIPVRHVRADEIISDGGHMINVTHADQVNAFLANVIKRVLEGRGENIPPTLLPLGRGV